MRVFVTGATGYIGSAVVAALARAGHRVTGLSRSEAGDEAVKRAGGAPVRGELGKLGALEATLRDQDALVHAAFDWVMGPSVDVAALQALLAAARAGGPRALVYTSGVWVLGSTPLRVKFDEGALLNQPAAAVAWRPAQERAVLDAQLPGVVTAVVRPGMVYGEKRGVVGPPLFESAVKRGAAETVGDGENRWAFVHRDDLGELYRLVVERRAKGIFHAVDGQAVKVKDAARAASAAAGRGGAIRAIPLAEARNKMGPVADALALDQVVVSRRAGEVGWAPRHPGFVQDAGAAFREWSG